MRRVGAPAAVAPACSPNGAHPWKAEGSSLPEGPPTPRRASPPAPVTESSPHGVCLQARAAQIDCNGFSAACFLASAVAFYKPRQEEAALKRKRDFCGWASDCGEGSRLSPAPVALGLIFCKQTHIQMYSAQAQQGQPGAADSWVQFRNHLSWGSVWEWFLSRN